MDKSEREAPLHKNTVDDDAVSGCSSLSVVCHLRRTIGLNVYYQHCFDLFFPTSLFLCRVGHFSRWRQEAVDGVGY